MGDHKKSGGKGRGRPKWTRHQKMGGKLPDNIEFPKGFSFPVRALHGTWKIPEEASQVELTEEQEWAVSFLLDELRSALICCDTKTIRLIADALEYRMKFKDAFAFECHLDYRLYNIARTFRITHPDALETHPDRRTAKRILLDQLVEAEQRKNPKLREDELKEIRIELSRKLPWTKAFNALAEDLGIYREKGRPGASGIAD